MSVSDTVIVQVLLTFRSHKRTCGRQVVLYSNTWTVVVRKAKRRAMAREKLKYSMSRDRKEDY